MQKIETIEERGNLYQRLSRVMSEAGTMHKGGLNDFSGYTYVKASDVAQKFQQLLLAHGVFVTANVEEVTRKQVESAKGKSQMYVGVKVLYTFINIDNPVDRFVVQAVGDGMDTGDKGIYKALTGSQKYLFSLNFCMGSTDDAETESPELGGLVDKGEGDGSFNF